MSDALEASYSVLLKELLGITEGSFSSVVEKDLGVDQLHLFGVLQATLAASQELREETSGTKNLDNGGDDTGCYDFQNDSNVSEAVKIEPLLAALAGRVADLLAQFEEHPTLEQIAKIIQRIREFPISSSLARFIEGMWKRE